MKTFKRASLPDSITYKGKVLKLNTEESAKFSLGTSTEKSISRWLFCIDKTCCKVEVMHRNLKGKTDLYGQPYKPSLFIFSN